MITILPVRSAKERKAFITMPWLIYQHDPSWVPPLIADMKGFIDPKKGIFFAQGRAELFIAYREGKVVGRISAQISLRHREIYQDRKGFFGFFECENRQETADALFATAEKYLLDQGCNRIEGPYNFTIYDEIGLLVKGFDTMPYVLNVHNRAYYQDLVESAGYQKAVDWYAYRIPAERAAREWPEKLTKLSKRIEKRAGLTVRPMEREKFAEEAWIVRDLFNAAWDKNWGHVPMSDAEFKRIAQALKALIIPDLSFMAEIDGKPVGFALSVYDANPVVREIDGNLFPLGFLKLLRGMKKTGRFRLMLMGVLDEYRGRGYEIVFYTKVVRRALELGTIVECEMSNVVETNLPMLKSLEHLPAEHYKTYRIYTKNIDTTAQPTIS